MMRGEKEPQARIVRAVGEEHTTHNHTIRLNCLTNFIQLGISITDIRLEA